MAPSLPLEREREGEAHGDWDRETGTDFQPEDRPPAPSVPPACVYARVTRSARRRVVHRQPRPAHAGTDGGGLRAGKGLREEWAVEEGEPSVARPPRLFSETGLRLGGRRRGQAPATAPAAETRAFPIDGKATLRQA